MSADVIALGLSDEELTWVSFLHGLQQSRDWMSTGFSDEVIGFWLRLKKRASTLGDDTRQLLLPITYPTEDSSIQLAWSTPERYLDIEIFTETFSWFCKDRASEDLGGVDNTPLRSEFSTELISQLGNFMRPVSHRTRSRYR